MRPAVSDRGARRPTPRIACFLSSLAIYSATKLRMSQPCNAKALSHKIQVLLLLVANRKERHVPPHRGKNYGCSRLRPAESDDQPGPGENRRDQPRMDPHPHRPPATPS